MRVTYAVASYEPLLVRRVPHAAEVCEALGCTLAEFNALSAEDRGELVFDYGETLPYEPISFEI